MTADSQTQVLVVEDDFAMRRLLERFLTGLGYRVHSVSSAGAALDVLRSEEIHAIVSDHHLGGMDGVQLLELCKRSFPSLPRILVTAADDFDIAARAVNEAGITALVRKPWAGPELAAALATVTPARAPSYQSASNTIPQFTALTRTSEAPVVSWDEMDSADSQRVLDANRDVASLQRLFGNSLSL